MRKFLLMMSVALALVSCTNTTPKVDYKAEGERMAKQLDELCEKQDTAAILAFDDSVHVTYQKVLESGDSAAIADFSKAIAESRNRNAAVIAAMKVKGGADREEVIQGVIDDALNGEMDIQAVTSSIDKVNEETGHTNQNRRKR